MKRVLVIDDSEKVRVEVGKHLTDAGYGVGFASNRWEGLLSLAACEADLVIVDLVMPGMDGETFLKILRTDGKHGALPVIVLIEFDIPNVEHRLNVFHVPYIIRKSLTLLDEVLAAARQILGEMHKPK